MSESRQDASVSVTYSSLAFDCQVNDVLRIIGEAEMREGMKSFHGRRAPEFPVGPAVLPARRT